MRRFINALLNRLAVRITPLVAACLAGLLRDTLPAYIEQALLPRVREQLLPEMQQHSETAITALRAELGGRPLVGSDLYLPNGLFR